MVHGKIKCRICGEVWTNRTSVQRDVRCRYRCVRNVISWTACLITVDSSSTDKASSSKWASAIHEYIRAQFDLVHGMNLKHLLEEMTVRQSLV